VTPEHVIEFLRSVEATVPEDATADTVLLSSGMIDSLVLFHLLEWIEARRGSPVDVLSLDLPADWDTPRAIAEFVARPG
jgi:hypothetical protein